MKYFKISDMGNRTVFDIELRNRITIITGESAQGKTMLVKFIDLINRSTKIITNENFNVKHINDDMILNGYNLNSNDIYIMDEYDGINNLKISNVINNRKYNFILITRNTIMPHISYDISDICIFSNSGKYHKLIKKYGNINKEVDKTKLDKIITEDSGSGNEFYKIFNNFQLISAGNNSKILKFSDDNTIFVVDSLGFGPYIKLYIQNSIYKNTFLIYPKSFEYLILISGVLPDNIGSSVVNKSEMSNMEMTLEQSYYKELKLAIEEYNIKFSKTYLDGWFKNPEIYSRINRKILELFDINLLELNNNLIKNNKVLNWE